MRTAAEVLRDISAYYKTPKPDRDKKVLKGLMAETDTLLAQEDKQREAWRDLSRMSREVNDYRTNAGGVASSL